jgi:hypothetical protein
MDRFTKILLVFALVFVLTPAISLAEENAVFDSNYGSADFLNNFGFFTGLFSSSINSEPFFNDESEEASQVVAEEIQAVEENDTFVDASTNAVKLLKKFFNALALAGEDLVYVLSFSLNDMSNVAVATVSTIGEVINIEFADEEVTKVVEDEEVPAEEPTVEENVVEEVEAIEEKTVEVVEVVEVVEKIINVVDVEGEFFWQAISTGGCSSDFHNPGINEGEQCNLPSSLANVNIWNTEDCPLMWEWKEMVCK